PQLCREFEAFMHEKFQLSAMGDLNFFLGLQVLQKEDGIFLSKDKYVGDILKKFGYLDVRSSNNPMDKENPWGKDGTGKDLLAAVDKFYGFRISCLIIDLLTKPFDAGRFQYLVVNSPSFSGRIVPLFDTMLIQHGEGSGTPTEPHHTPSQEAQPSSHTHISSPSIPTVTSVPLSLFLLLSHLKQLPLGNIPKELGLLNQDRATIAKSSTLPHDSAPRVTSHATEEGTQKVEMNRLKERVTQLEEREGVATINSVDDAPIKRRNAATVLASRVVDVPTNSGSILTASTPAEGSVPTGSEEVPTASLVFATATVVTPVTRRKGKEIARDAKIVRIHAEEEIQSMIDGLDSNNEIVAKYLEEYRQFSSELPLERRIELISDLVKDFRGMTFEEVEGNFNSVCKQMEDFIPMGSKEEAEKMKRKEKVKEMMNLVSIEEVYVEALQVKHPIIDWKVHSEGQRNYWKITRLVNETLSTRPPTSNKEMELWVELSRLYEPNEEDQLWTHTQNFMHALVDWKLYDSCRVHHVATKDKEIFMLVEKDYPLRKGLALVMICYKLQVENFS
nr:ribonuclease H-like domain, reverse transcriptase, RNA-dependent DNA polymerase [Tanacetum cinerariifolium]